MLDLKNEIVNAFVVSNIVFCWLFVLSQETEKRDNIYQKVTGWYLQVWFDCPSHVIVLCVIDETSSIHDCVFAVAHFRNNVQ